MQRIVILMMLGVTLLQYLANGDRMGRFRLLPGFVAYLPEILSALVVVLVIAAGVRERFRFIRAAYWMVFGALLLSIICGVIVNHVDSGPIFAGLRLYLRAIPWFFVPAVFAFSTKDIATQFKLLLVICVIQVPLAIEQRIKTGDSEFGYVAITGDWTTGTMGDSGILSIFLVACACVLAAAYEKRLLTLTQFLVLFLIVLMPTTINETKAMVVFLPVALMVAFTVAADPSVRVKRFVVGAILLLTFGAIFVPVYDAMNAGRQYGSTLGEFFLNSDNVRAYVTGSGYAQEPGRVDAIAYPLSKLAQDPVHLAFGYGIGNASDSSWGPAFAGLHFAVFKSYLQSALARFLLELGVVGVTLVLVAYWLILKDCRVLARTGNTLLASLAAGWAGVVALMVVSMPYALLESFPPIAFLFWYFSGIVAAERMRVGAREAAAKITVRSSIYSQGVASRSPSPFADHGASR